MQKNTSIVLGTHFDKFIIGQIKKGRYGSVSDTVRAGLRLLEEKEMKLALLRQSLIDGEKSGKANYSLKAITKKLDTK
jgi:antitoxin ParD1/3/4